MFKGEKTILFWAGLVILTLASVVLFSILWELRFYADLTWGFEHNVPMTVGATVFILLGLFMMRSGVKRNQPPAQN